MTEKRGIKRNKMWPETEAMIKYRDAFASRPNTIETLKANIDNLGAHGVFVKSLEELRVNTEVEMEINFNPGKKPDISLKAEGVVLRNEDNGFAVKFTRISTDQLGECIMQKLNL